MLQEIVGLLMAIFLTFFPQSTPDALEVLSPISVSTEVIRVVDGDTIVVSLGGKEEYVRYIGVDTPESYKKKTPECFSEESSNKNRRLVSGGEVRLIGDKENRDKYGRLLRYVYVSEIFINAELLKGGYARTLPIKPNIQYANIFRKYEIQAKKDGKGLWGKCM